MKRIKYIVSTYRGKATGWQDLADRPEGLADARACVKAIIGNAGGEPIVVKVVHPTTGKTMYMDYAGRLADLVPGREST